VRDTGPSLVAATIPPTRLVWRNLEVDAEPHGWRYQKSQSPPSSSRLNGSNQHANPSALWRLLIKAWSMCGFSTT
jgi:hypothetical protein